MPNPNTFAHAVFTTIAMWKNSIDEFEKRIASGFYTECDGVISGKNVDGSEFKLARPEAEAWKKRVARLEKEAQARDAAGDASWFRWIDEYASMKYETALEDFSERYTATIELAGKARPALAAGRKKGWERRREAGQRRAQQIREAIARGEDPPASARHIRRILRGK